MRGRRQFEDLAQGIVSTNLLKCGLKQCMIRNDPMNPNPSLFDDKGRSDDTPLAETMRPHAVEDFVGQPQLWAPGAPLRRLVEADRLGSWIFWGPPGCGKTSLARLIGAMTARPVYVLSAVNAGVKDLRARIEASEARRESGAAAELLFLDEIHRLNKSQQDVLLPALESGALKLIGATTENPSFEVNQAILSRSMVFRFFGHTPQDLVHLLQIILKRQSAIGTKTKTADDTVLTTIAKAAAGDARRAINLLETLLLASPDECTRLTMAHLESLGSAIGIAYDKSGDNHYDTISAFIKSIRASHPDAALHYLARMINAGEDPMFIARRLLIAASEDIGNANPTALLVATAAMQAVHMLGMPEARITLAQAVTYLAASPKSNRAYVAVDRAIADVERNGALPIPMHLRNAPTALMKEMGHGKDYAYAHDDGERARRMPYLPGELRGVTYYEPLDIGVEKTLKEYLKHFQPTGDLKP